MGCAINCANYCHYSISETLRWERVVQFTTLQHVYHVCDVRQQWPSWSSVYLHYESWLSHVLYLCETYREAQRTKEMGLSFRNLPIIFNSWTDFHSFMVLCQNARFRMIVCTSNPDFKIMPLGWIHSPVYFNKQYEWKLDIFGQIVVDFEKFSNELGLTYFLLKFKCCEMFKKIGPVAFVLASWVHTTTTLTYILHILVHRHFVSFLGSRGLKRISPLKTQHRILLRPQYSVYS